MFWKNLKKRIARKKNLGKSKMKICWIFFSDSLLKCVEMSQKISFRWENHVKTSFLVKLSYSKTCLVATLAGFFEEKIVQNLILRSVYWCFKGASPAYSGLQKKTRFFFRGQFFILTQKWSKSDFWAIWKIQHFDLKKIVLYFFGSCYNQAWVL